MTEVPSPNQTPSSESARYDGGGLVSAQSLTVSPSKPTHGWADPKTVQEMGLVVVVADVRGDGAVAARDMTAIGATGSAIAARATTWETEHRSEPTTSL